MKHTSKYLDHPLFPRKKRVFREINYLTIHIFHGILFFSVGKEGGDNTCLVTILIALPSDRLFTEETVLPNVKD